MSARRKGPARIRDSFRRHSTTIKRGRDDRAFSGTSLRVARGLGRANQVTRRVETRSRDRDSRTGLDENLGPCLTCDTRLIPRCLSRHPPRGHCCLDSPPDIMENVPPGANNDGLTFPDDSLRPKRNAWASRQKRSPALNTKTNADSEDEGSLNDSGLLTPPSSQTQENEIDPTRMLFSPPPEEMLRNVRSPVSVVSERFELWLRYVGDRLTMIMFSNRVSILCKIVDRAVRSSTYSVRLGVARTLGPSSTSLHTFPARRAAGTNYLKAQAKRSQSVCLTQCY